MQTIVIADPDPDFLEWTAQQLKSATTRVLTTTRADEAFELCFVQEADLLIAELHLRPYSGMELLKKVKEKDQNLLFLMTGAFGTTQAVIESVKLGAFDFLRKEQLPFQLKIVVEDALRAKAQLRAVAETKPRLTVEQHQDSLVGSSPAMQEVFKLIGRVSHSDAPVMITGESGSGKELVARAIHNNSRRSTRYFIAINCAAIPDTLLESELFGHERGAFTGAVSQRIGRFEQSNGGTLFLDEIGDMPLSLQSKILRVIQEGEFSRVGGHEVLTTSVRIIAATNKNLEEEVEKQRFRADLFYRLNVVRIHLPPLRERTADIRLLCEYFLNKISNQQRLPRLRLSDEGLQVMERYHWPGNVRELENTLQRAAVLATTDVLLARDIPLNQLGTVLPGASLTAGAGADGGGGSHELSGSATGALTGKGNVAQQEPELRKKSAITFLFDEASRQSNLALLPWLEREFVIAAMKLTGGNQLKAAKLLGITRATLRKRVERFGITKELKIE